MQQCCMYRWWRLTIDDLLWHTETSTGSRLRGNLALPHRKVTGQRNSSLHMTGVNLRLTLLKGSACQRVRLIGNKSLIQSEFEGNMRACAYSSMSTTCWSCRLSGFFHPYQTQWAVDSSVFKRGSLFLHPDWFPLYRWWWMVSGDRKSPFRGLQEKIF